MALTVGELVGYITLDMGGLQQGVRDARREMEAFGTDLTRVTERAGEQASQALGGSLAEGTRNGTAEAVRAATAGLDPLVSGTEQAGQRAGDGLITALATAGRTAGREAADATAAGLSGMESQARTAGDAAGGAIDDGLVPAARAAGEEAGDRAGDALESELEAAAEDAGERGGQSLADGLTAQDAALAGAGLALGAALISGFSHALEKENVTDRMNAQLGATGEDAGKYGEIAGNLWKNAVVEGVQDGADVVKAIAQQGLFPPDATTEQMESIATKVADVSNLMEEDFSRTAAAVGSMLRNGIARNAEEALDILTVGMQNGANKAEDLLDTFSEYSPFFAKLGLSADDALGILNQGLENGAWNSDILADALKEGLLLMQEMGEGAATSIEELGLNVEETHAAFTKGGPPARAALQSVLDALRNVPDETRRNALAVELFGTKAEDLQDALFALDPETAAAELGEFAGAAERAGLTMRDNASANIEKFKRTLQSGIVDVIGGEVIPALMDMARFAKTMWEGISPEGQKVIEVLGISALVLAGLTLGFGLASRGVAAFRAMLASLSAQAATTSLAMKSLQLSMGIVGVALVAATTVMSLFGAASKSAKADSGALAKSLEQDSGSIGKYTREQARATLETLGLGDMAQKAGIDMGRMVDAMLGVPGATEEVTAKFREYAETTKMGNAGMQLFTGSLSDAQAAMKAGVEEHGRTQEAQQATAEATDETTESVEDQEKALDDLSAAFDAIRGQFLDARAAEADLEAAVDDLTDSVKENGRTLDLNTEKGRSNDSALRDMVESAYDLSEATLRQTGSTEQANAVLLAQRQRLYDVLVQMGYTKAEAGRLTDQYFRIPADVNTDVNVRTGQAEGAIAGVKGSLAGLPSQKTITVMVKQAGATVSGIMGSLFNADGNIIRYYADGAHVAQIAPAGTTRVWAEPETGGEAYIPLAQSKRQRSTQILSEVARDFGYQLVPSGGRSFADGSAGSGGSAGAGAGTPVIGRLEIDLVGAESAFKQAFRKMIKDGGGNVQTVLGSR